MRRRETDLSDLQKQMQAALKMPIETENEKKKVCEKVMAILSREKMSLADADPDMANAVMHLAVETGNLVMLKLAVEKGADINARISDAPFQIAYAAHKSNFNKERIPETSFNIAHAAAYHGNLNMLKFVIGKGGNLDEPDSRGRCILHSAARTAEEDEKCLDVMRFLIEEKGQAPNINARDFLGQTVLHYAVQHRESPDIVEFLLENGAESDAVDKLQRSIGYIAALSGTPEIVEFLLRKNLVDKNARTAFGRSMLHAAAFTGLNVLKILLEDVEDINAVDPTASILKIACTNKNIGAIEFLLNEKEVDIAAAAQAIQGSNENPIVFYSGALDVKTLELLKKKGADFKAVNRATGLTFLHGVASCGGNEPCGPRIQFGLDNGVDPDAKNSLNETFLDMAAKRGRTDVLQAAQEMSMRLPAKAEITLEHGLNQRKEEEVTANPITRALRDEINSALQSVIRQAIALNQVAGTYSIAPSLTTAQEALSSTSNVISSGVPILLGFFEATAQLPLGTPLAMFNFLAKTGITAYAQHEFNKMNRQVSDFATQVGHEKIDMFCKRVSLEMANLVASHHQPPEITVMASQSKEGSSSKTPGKKRDFFIRANLKDKLKHTSAKITGTAGRDVEETARRLKSEGYAYLFMLQMISEENMEALKSGASLNDIVKSGLKGFCAQINKEIEEGKRGDKPKLTYTGSPFFETEEKWGHEESERRLDELYRIVRRNSSEIRQEIEEINQGLAELKKSGEGSRTWIQSLENALSRLKKELHARDEKIEQQGKMLERQDQTLQEQGKMLQEHGKEIMKLREEVRRQSAELKRLQAQPPSTRD